MCKLLLCALLTGVPALGQGIITTIAGTDFSFPPTPLPAKNAPLSNIYTSIASDAFGNVYFSDSDNNRVMKVDSRGTLTVIAGNGIPGFSGDGGPATSASLNSPNGVAADGQGDVFIGDFGNNRVRKVSPSGIITTIVDDAFVSVPMLSPFGLTAFSTPGGLAADLAGNVFFAEPAKYQVRKASPDGTISIVAGNGSQGFSGDDGSAVNAAVAPCAVAVDKTGTLFISDCGNGRVRKVTLDGIISTVAMTNCDGIAVDPAGDLLVTVPFPDQVLKISGGSISVVAGTGGFGFSGDGGPAINATFASPEGLAVDPAGNIYVGDANNDRIRKIAPDRSISTFAGNDQFSFSGDGGPALSATFHQPVSVTIDPAGNLLVADKNNHRIRKIDGHGIVTTVAGDGRFQFGSGDGGPAIDASFYDLNAVVADAFGNLFVSDSFSIRKIDAHGNISTVLNASGTIYEARKTFGVDRSGNLYFGSDNQIFKLTPAGVKTLVAGNGSQGYSGDQGPATGASLDGPLAMVVDAADNIFFADFSNCRVRKVDKAGIISTIAGDGYTGEFDYGEDKQATNAFLLPDDLALDTLGNLYIASAGLIRKVTPDGIIHTVGGNIFATAPGDGGPALQARIAVAQLTVDAAGNIFFADGDKHIREILATPPALSAGPAQLTFTGQSGGAAPPVQNIAVTSQIPNIQFSVSVSTSDGAPWLSSDISAGNTPRLVQIAVDPFSLAPGSYSGAITINTPYAAPYSINIPVSLTVSAGRGPTLAVDRNHISFTFPKGATAHSETIRVQNVGGGALSFSASLSSAPTASGGNPLSISSPNGVATPSTAVPVTLTADPSRLAPGTYTSALVIAGDANAGQVTVPITITVSSNPSALLLSQTGLSFTAIEQGGVVPPQNFGVQSLGVNALAFTANTSTLSPINWLGANSSPNTIPSVDVNVDASQLTAGRYYGLVNVRSPGAANSPQVVTTTLEVLPAGTDLGAVLLPNELMFNAVAGGSSPSSQQVAIYNLTPTPKTFTASSSDPSLAALPQVATVLPSGPTQIVVQPFTNALGPGTYQDLINLQFDDGRVRVIGVTVVVSASSSASSAPSGARSHDSASGCQPTQLLPGVTSLGGGFSVPAGWPVALAVQVQDDCGAPLNAGSVIAEFSNGDPPLSLTPLTGGRWDGTWQSNRTQAGVTVTVRAATLDGIITGAKQVAGSFGTNQQPPVVADSGITDIASNLAFRSLSPGTLASISGTLLSDQSLTPPSVPYDTSLGNTSVVIAGQLMPLAMTSQNQITAIIPYGIETNTRQQVVVLRDDTYSQPVSLNLTDASPAIFADSNGQGMIVDGNGNLISPSNAARPGDLVTIYCVGLGALQQNVNAGDYAPASTSLANAVSVSIGGQQVTVGSSGSAPAPLVGVYFAQVTIPSGVAPGDKVPVVITSLANPPSMSQAVTMAVRQ